MFQQGKDQYDEGVQTKDDMKLLYADNYLTYALKYNPDLSAAKKLASQVRAKTINMPNPEDNIPLAVTSVQRNPKVTALVVYIKSNHAAVEVNTDHDNFILVDVNGKEYLADTTQTKSFKNKALPVKTLKSQQEAEGVLAFTIDKAVGLQKFIYKDGLNTVEKYFP
jgi:hypothetical protein